MTSDLLALLGSALLGLVIRLGVILIFTWLALRLIHSISRRTAARIHRRHADDLARRARLETILTTGTTTAQAVVGVLALLMVLFAVGINIAPLLAGVGVAGLAVSLGAQAIIRDFIGGLLILIENQFRVGDVIQVGVVTGTVEQITLRATWVRDAEGRLWVVPNGEVRIVSNQTRDWSRAVVDLSIPFAADLAELLPSLETALARVADDPAVNGHLLDKPVVQGWNNVSDTGVQVRVTAKTAPGKQWEVARILRQHAISSLRAAGLWAKENGAP